MTDPSNEFHGRKGFKHGDMNNTLIKTHLGRTILVQHDVVTAAHQWEVVPLLIPGHQLHHVPGNTLTQAQAQAAGQYLQLTTYPQSTRLGIYKTARGVRLEPSLAVTYLYDAWVIK